jgi:hypothetical protein
MPYTYIGSPYSGTALEQEERYDAAMDYVVWLMNNTIYTPFSPIVHNHPLAMLTDVPSDYTFWKKHNRNMIKGASIFHVLNISGAKKSVGLTDEAKYADLIYKPIYIVTPSAEGNYKIAETSFPKLVEVLR